MEYGYARVAAASLELKVADVKFNTEKIIELMMKAEEKSVEFLVFPELCITAYSCGDLFFDPVLLEAARKSLLKIADASKSNSAVVMVGLPLEVRGSLFNCAAVIQNGKILGIVPQDNYDIKFNQRWFASAKDLKTEEVMIGDNLIPIGKDLVFSSKDGNGVVFGIETGYEAWGFYPPASYLCQAGAVIIFNLSADYDIVGKAEKRRRLILDQSLRCGLGYVYASANGGESSTDLVHGGHLIIAENGGLLKESERFYFDSNIILADIDVDKLKYRRIKQGTMHKQNEIAFRTVFFDWSKDTSLKEGPIRKINKHPFVPEEKEKRNERCKEILSIQASGLEKRIRHTRSEKLVIGISGGLDSTLALLVVVRTMENLGLPKSNILAVTMPGFGTTGRTFDNSVYLTEKLGASLKVIDIKEACLLHFNSIGHDINVYDVTYENVQARERTQILMDIANKNGALVIGTGDLSELALGWCTYNGDHMSMYAVNSGVPKTLIPHIIQWYADNEANDEIRKILYDIIDTPISPELLPPSGTDEILQKTEDILGPYEVHDFFLYNMLRSGAGPKKIMLMAKTAFLDIYTETQLIKWLTVFYKRFFSQQFKRSCLPDGPKVGSVNLSPRGAWSMPSDATADLWMNELKDLSTPPH
ncbi:MAG: NAD(+) synthase [Clostridiaceae bacterium]|nr:NAD(+) synthase [Clostridiaceae bacterium]